jgi:hypothetical protein
LNKKNKNNFNNFNNYNNYNNYNNNEYNDLGLSKEDLKRSVRAKVKSIIIC